MSAKRYELKTKYRGNESWDELEESPDGMYVRYEDYAESHRALRAETTAHENTQMQLEKMAAENVGLKESRQRLAEFIHEELDADYPLNMDIEIPSTDSFLAEARAQIAEEALKIMGNFTSDECGDSVYIAVKEFADNLRKGVQS